MPVDLLLLSQAVGNIVDNAFKYSFSDSVIQVSGAFSDKCFAITIEDEAELTAEEARLCPGRYWRSDHAKEVTGEGSGIGLWIVDHIMKAHQGSLTITPKPQNRVVVNLNFPIGDK